MIKYFQTGDVIAMPVPSSYNDITQDKALRDFIGWVWYDREVYVPKAWNSEDVRVNLRFESAHYNTIVVSKTLSHLFTNAHVCHHGICLFTCGPRGCVWMALCTISVPSCCFTGFTGKA